MVDTTVKASYSVQLSLSGVGTLHKRFWKGIGEGDGILSLLIVDIEVIFESVFATVTEVLKINTKV